MDHKELYVQVMTVLADGGASINAAINRISRDCGDGFKIWLRCCFAHVIRMGMTRGKHKRGGKDLSPCHLLDYKVPLKVMAKMMSIIILFNYIPNGKIFEKALKLFYEEFCDPINDHWKRNYLDGK